MDEYKYANPEELDTPLAKAITGIMKKYGQAKESVGDYLEKQAEKDSAFKKELVDTAKSAYPESVKKQEIERFKARYSDLPEEEAQLKAEQDFDKHISQLQDLALGGASMSGGMALKGARSWLKGPSVAEDVHWGLVQPDKVPTKAPVPASKDYLKPGKLPDNYNTESASEELSDQLRAALARVKGKIKEGSKKDVTPPSPDLKIPTHSGRGPAIEKTAIMDPSELSGIRKLEIEDIPSMGYEDLPAAAEGTFADLMEKMRRGAK